MGCFLACFGSSKDRKRRRQRHRVQPRDQRNASCTPPQSAASLVHDNPENTITPVLEVRDKPVEQLSSSTRKRVTFDSNITTYEHEVTDSLVENKDSDNWEEQENSAKLSQSQSSDVSSITSSSESYPPNHRYQNCRDSDDELEDDSDIDYHDDDSDGILEGYDDIYDDDYDNRISRTRTPVTEVATDEIDSSTVIDNLPEGDVKPLGLNRSTRDRSNYVHSVLNPVENLTQWKAVKARGTPPLKQQKENSALDHQSWESFSYEPCFKEMSFSFKAKSDQPKKSNQEIAVDTSLSTWLGSAESILSIKTSTTAIALDSITPSIKTSTAAFALDSITPSIKTSTAAFALDSITPKPRVSGGSRSNSPISFEDRPILGALTVEELKQLSAYSSPRKSPYRSPDEMPIIGTVGTYWNDTTLAKDSGSATSYKGRRNTTSKYREVYSK